MNQRTVVVFTGNRAEYGLQFPILKAIDLHPLLDYKLLVSGAHLDPNFGTTLNEIGNDGFHIDSEIKINFESSNLYAISQAIGFGVTAISKVLNKLKPDIMVVYADRFEGFAAVIAASQMGIPTAHIEGGDLTEGGALDDSVRHAMTKLSHIHFTTNQQATNRILAMGEEKWRVHTVGLPAIDLIAEGRYASSKTVIRELNINLTKPLVLFTQHPISTEFEEAAEQADMSLHALEKLANDGIQIIITYPNNDAGGQAIIDSLIKFSKQFHPNIQIRKSLGRFMYHGILALAKDKNNRIVCAGNSSSGIKETPAFGCPTINIGSRQSGRLRGENIIDVPYSSKHIYEAIRRGLFEEHFREVCRGVFNPYWLGGAGSRIAEILAEVSLDKKLIQKRMTLIGESQNGWFR